jgi:hypothetical protein
MRYVPPGQDRAMARWERPAEFDPGMVKAFEIVIPASEVTKPAYLGWDKDFSPEYAGKEVVWVPSPPGGYAAHFTVLFTSAEVTDATLPGWPGRVSMGTRLIAYSHLPNSQTVWLVAFEQELAESTQQTLKQQKNLMAEQARQNARFDPSEIPELRAYLYGHDADGTRYYVDVSMANFTN